MDYSVKENIAERFAKRFGAEMSENLVLRLFGGDKSTIR